MIPGLNEVKKLITHANCADGLGSAMIVRDVLPDLPVRFCQYGTKEYLELPAEPGLLFCDIIPPAKRAQEFVDAGAIVLDHHKGAGDIVAMFGDRGVFADEEKEPGVSGAVLAYRHVWEPLYGHPVTRPSLRRQSTEHFACLVGIRDTWQTQDEDWNSALNLHASLMAFPAEYWLDGEINEPLGLIPAGAAIRKQRDETVAKILDGGGVMIGDWFVFPDAQGHTSDVAEAARQKGIAKVCGFFHVVENGQRGIVFSLRSDGSFDVSKFAKHCGGGGHTKAAGFKCSGGGDPYERFGDIFRGYCLAQSVEAAG